MTKPRNQRKRIFLWLWWLLVTAIGGTLLGALSAPTDFFWYIIMSGLVVGCLQSLVLRCYIKPVVLWILASTSGWWLGITASIITSGVIESIVETLTRVGGLWEVFWLNLINAPVIFACLGIAQCLVLRRHSSLAPWWILASVIGGVVHGAVGATVCAAYCPIRGAALSSGTAWAGYGAVTGIVLLCLL